LYEENNSTEIKHIVFVAHNGRRFDIKFLFIKLIMFNISMFGDLVSKSYILDTVELAKQCPKKTIPKNSKLSTMYNYCTGMELGDSAHRAMADVLATVKVLQYESFWKYRGQCVYKVDRYGTVMDPCTTYLQPNNDSDTDEETPRKELGDNDSDNGMMAIPWRK
jgi:hypothetical protein